MPDPFAAYADKGDPFAAYADGPKPPAVSAADILSGRVGRDTGAPVHEPDTWLGGFLRSVNDQAKAAVFGNPMIEGAAHPQTTGDMLSMVLPSGAPSLLNGAKNLGGQLRTIAQDARELSQAGPVPATVGSRALRMPASVYQATKARLMDSATNAERAFQRAPLYQQMDYLPRTPAPLPSRAPAPPLRNLGSETAPAVQATMPPPPQTGTLTTGSGLSATDRAGLARQGYDPATIAKIEQQMQRTAIAQPSAANVSASGPAPVDEGGISLGGYAGDTERRIANQGPPAGTIERRGGGAGLTPDQDVRQAYRSDPTLGKQADAMRAKWADTQASGRAAIDREAAATHPLMQPRVEQGAERVARQAGLTKQDVRNVTGPVLGEAPGEASPIFPKQTLGKIVDDMRQIAPGPAREAYVARATSGKTQWQVENIRRTLEHLGLLAPLALGPSIRDELLRLMPSHAPQTPES